jgi:hypothetical protein
VAGVRGILDGDDVEGRRWEDVAVQSLAQPPPLVVRGVDREVVLRSRLVVFLQAEHDDAAGGVGYGRDVAAEVLRVFWPPLPEVT